ncbi:MAG: UDP-N-acetylglucosamine 4,6-dehydratase (inverting) [Hydrogenobacter thermophilus]|uniref:UDP-N-acetylglucosamine 4,6-dehydratase (inverting) n=1 Tax=Hydrogenobacter thermophilus TaxID=940 RepID=UPI001C7815C2|nr:UDP-N-acetylglucosamine 4,6-dehydratase (inverting) [Hydrogenobacter thermophilus]QWK19044.1 MAG: UDP-N-acetylglucosamine 4,6-dehydratase (inverting) [Hydrogenobacter thermophilus]
MRFLEGKSILITGGTGSFGRAFVKFVLRHANPKRLIIFSRDEFKQWQLQKEFPESDYPQMRFFLGDIRDKDRLRLAFEGVDYVVHAAALKHVPTLEYNPFEAVKTNILGAQNIIEVAIEKGVKKVVALSTDKAVSPVNLYGATKLTMEKLFVAGNAYVGAKDTSFSIVRYGNVVGSRGSVVPLFLKLVSEGCRELPITDERMTRFWITLEEGVRLVLFALEESVGGEVFVPKLPSVKVVDLAKAICPDCVFKIIGIRPGEKLHESLIAEDEARDVRLVQHQGRTYYVLLPTFSFESKKAIEKWRAYSKMPEGFFYRSDKNDWWLSAEEIRELLEKAKEDIAYSNDSLR